MLIVCVVLVLIVSYFVASCSCSGLFLFGCSFIFSFRVAVVAGAPACALSDLSVWCCWGTVNVMTLLDVGSWMPNEVTSSEKR